MRNQHTNVRECDLIFIDRVNLMPPALATRMLRPLYRHRPTSALRHSHFAEGQSVSSTEKSTATQSISRKSEGGLASSLSADLTACQAGSGKLTYNSNGLALPLGTRAYCLPDFTFREWKRSLDSNQDLKRKTEQQDNQEQTPKLIRKKT